LVSDPPALDAASRDVLERSERRPLEKETLDEHELAEFVAAGRLPQAAE
jgi:hypothetical protein